MKINAVIHKSRRAVSETEILMNSDFFEKKSEFIKISVSETTSLSQLKNIERFQKLIHRSIKAFFLQGHHLQKIKSIAHEEAFVLNLSIVIIVLHPPNFAFVRLQFNIVDVSHFTIHRLCRAFHGLVQKRLNHIHRVFWEAAFWVIAIIHQIKNVVVFLFFGLINVLVERQFAHIRLHFFKVFGHLLRRQQDPKPAFKILVFFPSSCRETQKRDAEYNK
jgi:hypothetical protein